MYKLSSYRFRGPTGKIHAHPHHPHHHLHTLPTLLYKLSSYRFGDLQEITLHAHTLTIHIITLTLMYKLSYYRFGDLQVNTSLHHPHPHLHTLPTLLYKLSSYRFGDLQVNISLHMYTHTHTLTSTPSLLSCTTVVLQVQGPYRKYTLHTQPHTPHFHVQTVVLPGNWRTAGKYTLHSAHVHSILNTGPGMYTPSHSYFRLTI